ncbi:MAG TPA: hypothetical protein VGL75_11840 [Acidothermaceae bacterium]|jgi:hypothetical protein
MSRPRIVLGRKYRDTVSGWEGIATARYEYLNGCVRYQLDAKDDKGAPQGYVFDEQQVAEVEAPAVEREPARRTGGPRDNAAVAR